MASFNKVILIGNLTRDPELRHTPKGTCVAKIGLALNRVWTTEGGEKKEEVVFVDVDLFGRTAEVVGQYMRKGSPLLVEGRLKLDQWDDKATGQKRSKLGVHGEQVQFLGKKDGDTPNRPAPASQPASLVAPLAGDGSESNDSDVPF